MAKKQITVADDAVAERHAQIDARWCELCQAREDADADAIAKIDAELAALIGETMRLHPEEFTQLPNGRWVSNERMTRN